MLDKLKIYLLLAAFTSSGITFGQNFSHGIDYINRLNAFYVRDSADSFYNHLNSADSIYANPVKGFFNTLLSNYTLHPSSETSHYFKKSEISRSAQPRYERIILSYREAREHLFGSIHLKGDENNGFYVKDIYCLKRYSTKGPMSIPNHNIINTEHVWPQSHFPAKVVGAKSDLHHLYPSDNRHNNSRGNKRFGDIAEENSTSLRCRNQGNRSGKVRLADGRLSTETFYEPPSQSKGNVARAIFYFSTMYNVNIPDDEEVFLRKWHRIDPVDEEELQRNEAIFDLQNNRNPFIDFPNIVTHVQNF